MTPSPAGLTEGHRGCRAGRQEGTEESGASGRAWKEWEAAQRGGLPFGKKHLLLPSTPRPVPALLTLVHCLRHRKHPPEHYSRLLSGLLVCRHQSPAETPWKHSPASTRLLLTSLWPGLVRTVRPASLTKPRRLSCAAPTVPWPLRLLAQVPSSSASGRDVTCPLYTPGLAEHAPSMVGLGPVAWDLEPPSGPAGPRGLGERRQRQSRLREASGAGRPGPPWVTVLKRGPAQAGVLSRPPARSARPQVGCFVMTQLSPPEHAFKFGSCPVCDGGVFAWKPT